MILFMLFVLIAIALFFGLLWSIAQEHEFSQTGVKYIQPIPYFGNFFKPLFGIEHFTTTMKNIYDTFQNERYVAIFEMFKPTIILRDPELIKSVTIKDFEYFHDFPIQIDENVDPVFGKVLLALKGKKWRHMRSTLSPAFTSSKMKNMFHFIVDCANKLTSHYEEQCENEGLDLDVHDLMTRFTNDSVASAVFSLEINSLKDRDNNFYQQTGLVTKQNLITGLKFAGFRVFPGLMKVLGITLLPQSATSYLINVISDTMSRRESNGEYRPDMIHLLNEAKKGNLKHDESTLNTFVKEFASTEESEIGTSSTKIKWSDEDLIPQALLFIFGGYTSTSAYLSFLFYELGVNQDVQDRLRVEIDDVLKQNDGKMTYDDILRMTYMDMVISEGLRKWPPTPFINRLCVKDYDFGPINPEADKTFKIRADNSLWIPVYCLHMDPEYWPNPTKFDPERFSDENKHNIVPQTYLPFGSGPRNCLGSRFALMMVKVVVFHLLAKFKFDVCSKTVIPIRLRTNSLFFESKDGYWLNMKRRQD